MRVITKLDSQLYRTGEVLIEQGSKVENLYVVASGKLRLYGSYQYNGEESKMLIVRLP